MQAVVECTAEHHNKRWWKIKWYKNIGRKKETQKKYFRYSGYPGGLAVETVQKLRKRAPQEIFKSPKPVIAGFISWLFEADGCAFGNGRGRTSVQSDGKLISAGQSNENTILLTRYLGGNLLEESTLPISSYGKNSSFISDFLYINFYATIITDSTAQAATISAMNAILSQYSFDYNNQPNFNFVAYLYLLEDQLIETHATLASTYPGSITELDLFFSYINDRITNMVTNS